MFQIQHYEFALFCKYDLHRCWPEPETRQRTATILMPKFSYMYYSISAVIVAYNAIGGEEFENISIEIKEMLAEN